MTAPAITTVSARGAEIGRVLVARKKALAFRRTAEGLRQLGPVFNSPRMARRALIEATKHG